MDKKQCYEKLRGQLEKIEDLKNERPYSAKFSLWDQLNDKLLNGCLDENTISVYSHIMPTQSMLGEQANTRLYLDHLERKKEALESLLEVLESEDNEELYDAAPGIDTGMHKKIIEVSQGLFEDKHYPSSIFEAFKKLINEVKALTPEIKSKDDYGRMGKVFSPENPIIKFNKLSNQSEIDEQRGFMHLFQGAVMLRNMKGHENVKLDNPERATEYLTLASFLMKKLDERIK